MNFSQIFLYYLVYNFGNSSKKTQITYKRRAGFYIEHSNKKTQLSNKGKDNSDFCWLIFVAWEVRHSMTVIL